MMMENENTYDDGIITLYDENNEPGQYEIIDVFELNDSVYAGVTPYVEEYDEDAMIEITMLRVIEDPNGDLLFSLIDSEEEEKIAYDELIKRDDELEDE